MLQSVLEEESSIDDTFTKEKNILTSHQQSMEHYEVSNNFECENEEFKVTFGNSDLHEGCRSYSRVLNKRRSHINVGMVIFFEINKRSLPNKHSHGIFFRK